MTGYFQIGIITAVLFFGLGCGWYAREVYDKAGQRDIAVAQVNQVVATVAKNETVADGVEKKLAIIDVAAKQGAPNESNNNCVFDADSLRDLNAIPRAFNAAR